MRRQSAWSVRPLLLIAATAVALLAPLLLRGNVAGHDFDFHVRLWLETVRQWHQGIVYPTWSDLAAFNHGEPTFLFYPPISWMLGAVAAALLPMAAVPIAMMLFALVLAGALMYRAVLEISDAKTAIWAAVLYVANPYHALIVYRRSDFAELIVGALFPLAMLFLWRVLGGDRRAFAGLALTTAAFWLTNLPAALIATYVIGFMLLVAAAGGGLTSRRSEALTAALAVALGIGTTSFFLLPAAYEQRWVRIASAVQLDSSPRANFLFQPWHGWMHEPAWWYRVNLLVSLLACAMVCAGAVGWLLSEPMKRRQRMIAATLSAAGCWCAFMMFPLSWPLWRVIPKLQFVQFPWRFLLPLCFVVVFFVAHARYSGVLKAMLVAATLVLVGAVALFASTWKGNELARELAATFADGYKGRQEYVPIGSRHLEESDHAPEFALSSSSADAMVSRSSVRESVWAVASPVETSLTLRRTWYPAWRASIDGRAVTPERNQQGSVVLRIPAGRHQVRIWFARTWDRNAGLALSLLSAIALATVSRRLRKPRRAAPSSQVAHLPAA